MRIRPIFAVLLVAALALVAAGCGDRNLILRVDVLSFLDPAETQGHYGPIPAGTSGSVTIADSRRVDLLPGLHDVTTVSSVTVDVAGIFANQSGTGTGEVGIYVSPEGTDPFTTDTSPILMPVTFAGADTDTVAVTVAGDSDLANAFLGKVAQIGIRLSIDAAPGPDPVEGDFKLTQLRAIVEAKQDLN